MTIIKIHGVSGSGKTTAVNSLINSSEDNWPFSFPYAAQGKPLVGKCHRLIIPEVERPVYVIGDYSVKTGGVDSIGDVGVIPTILKTLDPKGHVVFEGLLTSTYYGAIGEDSQQYGKRYVYAFLDTPEEECVRRVKARRLIAGVKGDYNPDPAKQKWLQVERVKKKAIEKGHNVQVIQGDQYTFYQLVELLNLYD